MLKKNTHKYTTYLFFTNIYSRLSFKFRSSSKEPIGTRNVVDATTGRRLTDYLHPLPSPSTHPSMCTKSEPGSPTYVCQMYRYLRLPFSLPLSFSTLNGGQHTNTMIVLVPLTPVITITVSAARVVELLADLVHATLEATMI